MTTQCKIPKADKTVILASLDAMYNPDDIIELRGIQKNPKKISSGYFDGEHCEQVADAAVRLNNAGATIHINMNQIDPQLRSRVTNQIQEYAKSTTTDKDIIKRRGLLVDIDPVREPNTSATEEQMEAAVAIAKHIVEYLKKQGWPKPIIGMSGNGIHLIFPLDLPNDNESRELVKGALAGLAAKFDNDFIKIDQSVFNAARITKLFGTVANKGQHTAQTPWRLSKLILPHKGNKVVSPEQLKALAPPKPPLIPNILPSNTGFHANFDLTDFLERLGIDYTKDIHDNADRYKLARCPFNSAHVNGEAAIFRFPDGKFGFKCQHNSCADKHWQDVRSLVDGPRDSRNKAAIDFANYDWPDPQPVPEGLPMVDKFDYALLPDSLQPWAQDICERMQCAPDYVGVTIMAGLGSIVGRKLSIRPQANDDWAVTSNQWALVVGRPGVLKSPAMDAALSPIKHLAAKADEKYKIAMEEYVQNARLAKLKAEEGEKKARKDLRNSLDADVSGYLNTEEPEAPALRRYIANDSTAAALGELHRENHNGLLIFRDEMVSLLKSLDREDHADARGFYLTGWNGDSPYTFDRIGRGMNLHIPAVCLSLLGSTQPGKIAEYIRAAVNGGVADDGLIQRFGLLVWPDNDANWKNVDRLPNSDAKRKANHIFERLDTFDPFTIGAQQDIDHDGESNGQPYLRFDKEAQKIFLEWRTNLENRLRNDDLHPALESHMAKYRKLVPGLALILHLADNGTGPVSIQATKKAIALAKYLETHAQRAYASVTNAEVAAAKAIMKKLHRGELTSTFAARDIYRKGWAHLSNREQVQAALDLLVDLDQLKVQSLETPGRYKLTYVVNPKALAL